MSGRTARASLHAYEHLTCPPVYLSIVNCSGERTHGPCVPTYIILKANISHITKQRQPYCAVKWVILRDDMADIVNCDEENGKVKRWKMACKKRKIESGGRLSLLFISI